MFFEAQTNVPPTVIYLKDFASEPYFPFFWVCFFFFDHFCALTVILK